MNILIIGGAGYIGGVTAHMAAEAGHAVTVFDNLSTGRDYNVPKDAELVIGDVQNRDSVAHVFKKRKFDVVMHFAARILVPESVKAPYDYFYTNTFGALTAIDTAMHYGVERYIFSSSAATYGEPHSTPLTESSPTAPVNPYGWSKLLAEQILQSYQQTHSLQWTAFRYFNVAGAYAGVGTDYPFVSHIIPSLLVSMKQKKPIMIAGNDYDTPDGTCIRDYVHVADIAKAHVAAAEQLAQGKVLNQPINLSSGTGYSVKQVADTFNEVTHADLPIKFGPRRAGDPAKLFASHDRASQLLGWQPNLHLRQIITDHYNWYKAQDNPNRPV